MSTENTAKKPNHDSTKSTENRIRSSTKRPRAPIACFRCHHKKVRCDGAHPNCTRCLTTGVLCAYPSSRRSRTTQPTNVDPFIDNLSHLEARIRRIETDLENQRSMVHSIVSPSKLDDETMNELSSKMLKTEIEVQDSRSILAQLRLRGEQRISRGKRAAAAAAAAAAATAAAASGSNSTTSPHKEEKAKNNRQSNSKSCNKLNKKPKHQTPSSPINQNEPINKTDTKSIYPTSASSFYFQGMMLDQNTELHGYENAPPGHGMDWTLFENQQEFMGSNDTTSMQHLFHHGTPHLMFPEKLVPSPSRSSSLAFPVNLQPSNSTTSTTSNATSATSCSSLNSCDNIFGFAMDDMMIHSSEPQDVQMLSNHPSVWYYPS